MSFCLSAELQSSSCGNPGVPAKGILNGTRFNVGDRIRYRCVTGYTLDGHAQLTCVTSTSNVAVWDFPVPICRGRVCRLDQVSWEQRTLEHAGQWCSMTRIKNRWYFLAAEPIE
ncbi:hypothetical protein MHYP_G00286050 [Metynnis hypsauchen]